MVGDWAGFVGGDVTGGCARRRGAAATRPGCEKAPPTVGRRGLLEVNFSQLVFLPQYLNFQAALLAH